MLAHIRGMARDESVCQQHSRDDLLMCGACAVLNNAPDWADRVGNPEGIGHGRSLTRAAERQRRVALVNLLLQPNRIKLFDLGNNFSLQGPTGRVEIVEGLAHIWAAADRLSADPIDPLNLDQIEAIERSGHANPGR
jgi:hypothetical protein